jgi:hypothetical protein
MIVLYHLKLQLEELLLLFGHLGVTVIRTCILLPPRIIVTISLLRGDVRFARTSSRLLWLPTLQCYNKSEW